MEAVAGPEKEKMKFDDTSLSLWLQSKLFIVQSVTMVTRVSCLLYQSVTMVTE